MRYICTSILLLVVFSYMVITSFTAAPQARNMIATIYDDGKSCPNNCDAHVVFNPRHNGTRNAFDPASDRAAPRKCAAGQPCKICFSADASSCMLATYRGAGPAVGRFDFTPAFFEENCPKPDMPAAFARQCRSAQPAIDRLKNRINCVTNPEHEKCKALMEAVVRRKAADDVLYDECKRIGEAAFNRKYRNQPGMQRSNDCSYTMLRTGGPNSKGERWRRLLDGACRPGTFVGKNGLDCCSGSLYAAAFLGSECQQFFVQR
jgi:hypothetical protein